MSHVEADSELRAQLIRERAVSYVELRCAPGSMRCLDAVNVEYCDDEGQLQTFMCGVECIEFDVGTLCRDAPYQEISGRLQHEYFPPNNTLSEWNEEARQVDASEVLVISYVYDNEEYRALMSHRRVRREMMIKVAEDPNPNDLTHFQPAKYHEGSLM